MAVIKLYTDNDHRTIEIGSTTFEGNYWYKIQAVLGGGLIRSRLAFVDTEGVLASAVSIESVKMHGTVQAMSGTPCKDAFYFAIIDDGGTSHYYDESTKDDDAPWTDSFEITKTINPLTGVKFTASEVLTKVGLRIQISTYCQGYLWPTEIRSSMGDDCYLEVTYTPNIPTVTTQEVSEVNLDNTALGNGTITNTGGENATKRGICWNTTGSPTVADNKTEEEGDFGIGAFTAIMTGLSPEVTYYIKAYAYNSAGYGYGAETTLYYEKVYPHEDDDVIITFTIPSGDSVIYLAYGEWVKFVTAAPGAAGGKPSGYKNDICSDYNGYTYILNRSLKDDGESYESYFVLSTDLSGGQTLHTNKRLLDIFTYFINKGSGTADIYVKRDTEAAWQLAGEVTMSGEQEIIIKHLPVDYLAKTYLFKFVFENDFEFVGVITEAVAIGDRPHVD